MSQSHNQQQQPNKAGQAKKTTPMIVEKVNKIAAVQMAVSVGYSQYAKLKSSNVTVGDLMTRAENLAAFFWSKVQPIVEKLEGPIGKADQLACCSFDYVENKLQSMSLTQK